MNAFLFYLLLLLLLPVNGYSAETETPQGQRQYTLSPEQRAKAKAYAHARHLLYFGGQAVSFAVFLALVKKRTSRWQKGRWSVPSVLLILLLAQLPLDAYRESLSRFYGQSIESWPSWFADQMKEWAIFLLIGTLTIWGIHFLICRSPKRWWLWAWLCSIPLQLAGVFLSPLVIEPLFFRFQPLEAQHPELVEKIELILHRAGVTIPHEQLLEMKASEKTNSLNAYVSGFGSSKRLVLWDTIIAKEDHDALLTTVGHELGHYVLQHIRNGIVFAALFTLAGFLLLHGILTFLLKGRPLSDWSALPLALLVTLVLAFISTPLVNAFIRNQEHEADRYALEVTHGVVPNAGQAAARAFQIEGESALADPDPSPFIRFWLYDHPPLADRLRFSLDYDPWRQGAQPKYVR